MFPFLLPLPSRRNPKWIEDRTVLRALHIAMDVTTFGPQMEEAPSQRLTILGNFLEMPHAEQADQRVSSCSLHFFPFYFLRCMQSANGGSTADRVSNGLVGA